MDDMSFPHSMLMSDFDNLGKQQLLKDGISIKKVILGLFMMKRRYRFTEKKGTRVFVV